MKKGTKITLALAVILIGTTKIKADTVNQWADNLPVLNRVQMYECGASQCYEKTTDYAGIQTGTEGDRKYVYSSINLTVDSSGGTVIQTTNGDVLNKGYLYLTKFYICNKPNISSYNYKIGNTNFATPNQFNADILALNDSALSTSPGITSIGYSSCRLYSGLYVPTTTGNNWISIQFKSNTTQKSKFAVVAVQTENLGIYTDTVRAIVESANGNVVEAVDKVNDTLNQDHSYNTDPSESTQQEEKEINDYENQEDNLRNGLNLEVENSEITINPEANEFIWNVINRLRGMNGKIVLLITSVLSLGLIKIVLGR